MLDARRKDKDMLEILNKKEALNRYMEGEEIYTTVNFIGYKKIERCSLEDIREERDWDGNHIFFIARTKNKYFKTTNNSFLSMKRINWERFRDICMNYCNRLEVPNSSFLIENEEKDDILFATARIKSKEIKGINLQRLNEVKEFNIYEFRVKEGRKK